MGYSKDFIACAAAYKDNNHTFKELREAFGIPAITYYDWKEKMETGFEFGVKAKQERNRKIDKAALKQAVEEHPDKFLSEYAEQFHCSAPAIFYALKKMKITHKKNIHVQRKI